MSWTRTATPIPRFRVQTHTVGGERDVLTGIVQVPAHAPVELHVTADGYVKSGRVVTAPPPNGRDEHVFTLLRRAWLQLKGDFASVDAAGESFEPEEGSLTIGDLAPGPLRLTITRNDGRRLVVDLELAEGEERTLKIAP